MSQMHAPEVLVDEQRYLLNTWYAAMWSHDLAAGTTVARTILGQPLVFWRSPDGEPTAIDDRCPHRCAPLSMGRLIGDRLRCGYHGLEFDRSGRCVRNPHPNGAIPPTAFVRSYTVVERYSILWIWMGNAAADATMIPDYGLLDAAPESHISKRDYLLMAADYELIIDNLLDLSHASYLHEGLLGNEEMIDAKTEVERDGNTIWVSRSTPNVPVPKLFDLMFRQDGKNVDLWTRIRWQAPACLLNDTGACAPGDEPRMGTGLFGIHLLTPETSTTAHYHFCAVRQNVKDHDLETGDRVRNELTVLRRRAFEEQDRAMIEAQQRTITRTGKSARAALLSVDAGIVRYHRVLDELREQDRKLVASA